MKTYYIGLYYYEQSIVGYTFAEKWFIDDLHRMNFIRNISFYKNGIQIETNFYQAPKKENVNATYKIVNPKLSTLKLLSDITGERINKYLKYYFQHNAQIYDKDDKNRIFMISTLFGDSNDQLA